MYYPALQVILGTHIPFLKINPASHKVHKTVLLTTEQLVQLLGQGTQPVLNLTVLTGQF